MNHFRDALNCLIFAEDARLSEAKLKELYSNKYEFQFIENSDTDTQGFLIFRRDIKTVIISFRGSQQLRDWFTDFNAFHMVYPYNNKDTKIRVHHGIYKAYLSIRPIIFSFIKPNLDFINHLMCVGHSLGGALATFCAVDIQYNFPSIDISGFASGNPDIGNAEFVQSFNKSVPEFITTYKRNDWVPKMPPRNFGNLLHGGYRKAGILNPIGKCDFTLGLKLWLLTNKKLRTLAEHITNHSIDMYRKDLNGLIRRIP